MSSPSLIERHTHLSIECREDLNILVKRHIQSVVSSYPSKALAMLENDASELIASGMVTLNAKLTGIDDDKLVARVVEIWGFFWDQVLTYLEGVSFVDPLVLTPQLTWICRSFYLFKRTHYYHLCTVPPNLIEQHLLHARLVLNPLYPL